MRRALLCSVLLFAGCGDDPGDLIEGDWVVVDDAQYALSCDGEIAEVRMTLDGKPKVQQYRYRILRSEPNLLVMDWEDREGGHTDVTAKFEGETMHLDFGGQEFHFKRD